MTIYSTTIIFYIPYELYYAHGGRGCREQVGSCD